MTATIESLPVLVLYPHARCNCRCVMCDIWKNTTTAELSSEELARHLSDLETLRVKWVIFSGGEPLMHSDLFSLADMLRARNIRVSVLSTGLLLKRHARAIAAHIDDLIVSLDGPAAIHDQIRGVPGGYRQLEHGIHEVLTYDPSFQIAGRCTIQKRNHDHVRETVLSAKELRLSSISFLAVDLTSKAFNRAEIWTEDRQAGLALTLPETLTLEAEFGALQQEVGASGFVLEGAEKLSRIVGHFRAHLGLCEPAAPICNAPWVSAVVEVDGTVRPCFFHRPIGSLRTHTLLQVLNGFDAQAFRSSLDVSKDATCKRCVCSLHVAG